jgi:hypothetical protein
MSQLQQVNRMRSGVAAYVEAIAVPDYDLPAVQALLNQSVAPRGRLRWAAAALAAAVIVVGFVFASPMVVAQVERMLQAFASINGVAVPVNVSSVSLEQARRDMPFDVVAPAAVPAGMRETIDELNVSSSHLDSRLVFRFNSGEPDITFIESSARARAPQQLRLMMTESKGGAPLPPMLPPGAQPGHRAFVQFGTNGQMMRRVAVAPIIWVVRGTRIELLSPPGSLSNAQIAAIHRAMSP